jgi:hypothetical protein
VAATDRRAAAASDPRAAAAATGTHAGEVGSRDTLAAPERAITGCDRSAALIAAALALPGVMSAGANAQSAPDQRVVALRYYDYRDWQPGADRMTVRSPSLYAFLPLSDTLTV